MIDAEDDLHQADRDILKLENALTYSQQKIFQFSNQTGFLDVGGLQLIDIQGVMEVVRNIPIEPSITHAALIKRNLNANLAIQEQAVRRAQEENTMEYFQAKIGGTDDNGFRQNFSLGFGFRIPVRNTQQENLDELEFEKIDEQLKYKELPNEVKKSE